MKGFTPVTFLTPIRSTTFPTEKTGDKIASSRLSTLVTHTNSRQTLTVENTHSN